MPTAWRPDLFVLARFLAKLAPPGTALTRSRLQVGARVNYDILRRYAQLMTDRGWIEWSQRDGQEVASLTPAGHAVHEELQEWLLRMLGETML